MWAEFQEWWSRPFRSDMSAGGWFAFLTLLAVIAMLQGFILRHIDGR